MFKNLDFLNDDLNDLIETYLLRIDSTQRDREFFYDIIHSVADYVSIKSKLDLIQEIKNKNSNDQETKKSEKAE
jgi:hypothetical protein